MKYMFVFIFQTAQQTREKEEENYSALAWLSDDFLLL